MTSSERFTDSVAPGTVEREPRYHSIKVADPEGSVFEIYGEPDGPSV